MAVEFSKPSFVRTLALILLAIGGLSATDLFLAKTEREANAAEAARYDREGERLMQAGRSSEAADRFQSALSLERDNEDYQLALAQALDGAGRLEDAEKALRALLERNSFSGPANLAMARVLVKQGHIDQAIAYYHRAIYGQWSDGQRSNPVRVRLELADLLSRRNSQEDLLAELLPLQDQAPEDAGTRLKMGKWFLAAGSPNRAASVFRTLLREQPELAEAYAGLGEAEFAQGNYRMARAEFQAALRLKPGDAYLSSRLEVCDLVLRLDPHRNGLSAEEESERSRKLLELAADAVKPCAGSAPEEPIADLLEAAAKQLKKRGSAPDNIELAQRLWQTRKAVCGAAAAGAARPGSDEALELVMGKLSQ
ncbi:MAG TPA: tetratricopeptide repeat protein [Bryobacteraceae bacterium]|nr:tetratricopeptide repeat protein [Bryobacteraceae bacterium]